MKAAALVCQRSSMNAGLELRRRLGAGRSPRIRECPHSASVEITDGFTEAVCRRRGPSARIPLDGVRSRRRRHGLCGARRGAGVVPVAVRAAARPRLSLGGHGGLGRRDRARRLAQGPPPQPHLRRQLLGHLHHPRAHRDGPRKHLAGPPRHPEQDLGGADHRHGGPLRRRSVRRPAEQGVAGGRADGAGRQRRPDRRGRRIRGRLDAVRGPHPGRDPLGGGAVGLGGSRGVAAGLLLGGARDPLHRSPRSPSPA